jgi:hypothetical protein
MLVLRRCRCLQDYNTAMTLLASGFSSMWVLS